MKNKIFYKEKKKLIVRYVEALFNYSNFSYRFKLILKLL